MLCLGRAMRFAKGTARSVYTTSKCNIIFCKSQRVLHTHNALSSKKAEEEKRSSEFKKSLNYREVDVEIKLLGVSNLRFNFVN